MTYGEKLQSAMKAKDLTLEQAVRLTDLKAYQVKAMLGRQTPIGKYYPKTNRLIAILDVDRNGDPIFHRGNGHETTALRADTTGTPTLFGQSVVNQTMVEYSDRIHETGLDRRAKKYAIVEVGSGKVVSRF